MHHRLVAWTSGNVSARVPGEGVVVDRPTGRPVRGGPRPAGWWWSTSGRRVDGEPPRPRRPRAASSPPRCPTSAASPAPSQPARPRRQRAASRESRACCRRWRSDFGGPIRSARSRCIGGEDIGRAVVESLSGHRSPARPSRPRRAHARRDVALGERRSAIKAAVMCADGRRAPSTSPAPSVSTPLAQGAIDAPAALPGRLRPALRTQERPCRPHSPHRRDRDHAGALRRHAPGHARERQGTLPGRARDGARGRRGVRRSSRPPATAPTSSARSGSSSARASTDVLIVMLTYGPGQRTSPALSRRGSSVWPTCKPSRRSRPPGTWRT